MYDRGCSSLASGASDRAFGFVLAGFFTLFALYPLLAAGPPRWWALLPAAAFLIAALTKPVILSPLNRGWTRLALALNRVASPVALLVVYCVAVVPTGLLLRVFKKDPLNLRVDRGARTYWIERLPPGRADAQMRKQF